MNDKHCILGVHITDRLKNAAEVQKVFTEYGCNIKTRVGIHDVHEDSCAGTGLVLLELVGGDAVCAKIRDRLRSIEGVDVQAMIFAH